MRLMVATGNSHKAREISEILAGERIEVLSLKDRPEWPAVSEDQPTIEGNARKKAVETARLGGLWVLADDTGLEVAALGGAPGVFSARYAGEGCDYSANNDKLLAELRGVPSEKRGAVFRTVMALSDPSGQAVMSEGRLEGMIAQAPRGANGFGYDPLFFIPGEGRTLAELDPDRKNAVSHRRMALDRILPRILEVIRGGALAALVVCAAAPVWAGRTEPGQETVWDDIMASQAYRGLRTGSRYLEAKQYELAEKEFLKAVVANPKDPVAHMMLGAAYYWTGKVEQGLSEYRTSLELDPKNAQTVMLLGIALAYKGDGKGAYESFKKSAELDPSRADVQMNLGSIEETMGLIPEAMAHFRNAVKLDPKHPLYHFQLGMLYRRLGRDSEAIESMREALKYYSGYEDALLELGAADERRGDRKAAIHSFRKAVGLKSRDAVARFRLGRLYLMEGERAKAREVLAEAFHLTPEGEGGGLQLSVSFAGGKRKADPAGPKDAKPEPKSNDPLDVFARNLERIPLEQGAQMQVDVAFVPKPKLVKADASEVPSALKKALEKAAQGPMSGHTGTKIVRKQFSLPPAAPVERARQIEKVISDLRQTMQGAPVDADVRLGMNLTFTRLAEGGVSGRADAESQPKASYQPRQVGNDLGLWVIGTGWMGLVEEVLPEAGEEPSHPNEADWWVATGLGFASLGEGQRALSAFEKASRLDPDSEIALLGRGVASVMTGYDDRAVQSFKEVLRINPKSRSAQDSLNWLLRPVNKPASAGDAKTP